MGLTATLVFYLLFGGSIAVATCLVEESPTRGERAFRVVTAFFFWPLYLPILLQHSTTASAGGEPQTSAETSSDDMAAAIAQVEMELDAALQNLDGWAEDVIARESGRVAELRAAWNVQAERIRELDRLLSRSEFTAATDPTQLAGTCGRLRQSEEVRLDNLRRLEQLRQQMHDDLMGTLAWVRELVTMIHLAKYTGAPASRAEELVAQIAASVEGLSEVTRWQEIPATLAARSGVAAGNI